MREERGSEWIAAAAALLSQPVNFNLFIEFEANDSIFQTEKIQTKIPKVY